jgi:hypothetical protein
MQCSRLVRGDSDEMLRGINTAGVEWMAAANTPQTFQAAFPRAILFHCPKKIVAASGIEATLPPKERTQHDLVTANHKDQHSSRQVEGKPSQDSHFGATLRAFANLRASRGRDCRTA